MPTDRATRSLQRSGSSKARLTDSRILTKVRKLSRVAISDFKASRSSVAATPGWEVVQSVVHQPLELTILVRVQASQPNFYPFKTTGLRATANAALVFFSSFCPSPFGSVSKLRGEGYHERKWHCVFLGKHHQHDVFGWAGERSRRTLPGESSGNRTKSCRYCRAISRDSAKPSDVIRNPRGCRPVGVSG